MRSALAFLLLCVAACSQSSQQPDAENVTHTGLTLYNDNEDGFTLIAHRGASAYTPENTLAAVRKAIEMRAEMVEVDLLLTKDGIPVLLHDPSLERTTNGSGVVDDYTYDELRLLDAGSWFAESFAGERIPTLDQLLEMCKGNIALNLEIKKQAVTDDIQGGVVEKVVDAVRRHGMERHVIISSFDSRAILQLKQIAPELPGAILFDDDSHAGENPVDLVQRLGADAFNCHWTQANPDLVNALHRAGIPVNVYTVNADTLMHKMLDLGVDGIFTDHPDVLLQVLRERNPAE